MIVSSLYLTRSYNKDLFGFGQSLDNINKLLQSMFGGSVLVRKTLVCAAVMIKLHINFLNCV